MDEKVNADVARKFEELARRFGLMTRTMTARFTGGGGGYQVEICPVWSNPSAFGGLNVVITFHNDDQFGPRYSGRAGAQVPADKVEAYVELAASDPDMHPVDLNARALGPAWRG